MNDRRWTMLAALVVIVGAFVVVAFRPTPPVIGFVGGIVGVLVPSLIGVLNMAKSEAIHNDLKNGLIPEKVKEAIAETPLTPAPTDPPVGG